MNLQEILDRFGESKVANLKNDKLVCIQKQKPIFEYNVSGEIIHTYFDQSKLRVEGIRFGDKSNDLITKEGRIFSKSKFNTIDEFKSFLMKRKNKISRQVEQYTLDGILVRTFECIADVKEIGLPRRNVNRCVQLNDKNPNKNYSAYGFVWKYKKP